MLRAQQHLLVVGRQNAMERLSAFLLDMVERQGGLPQIDVPMSRQDMGDYLGLTIETVSRTLTRFKESGAIRMHSLRHMEVCQPEFCARSATEAVYCAGGCGSGGGSTAGAMSVCGGSDSGSPAAEDRQAERRRPASGVG